MVADPRHLGDEFCVASEGGLESGTTWEKNEKRWQ